VRLITCRYYINADCWSCIQRHGAHCRQAHNVPVSSALSIRQLPPNRHCNLCVVQSCNIARHPTSSITGYLNRPPAGRPASAPQSQQPQPQLVGNPLRHCVGWCVLDCGTFRHLQLSAGYFRATTDCIHYLHSTTSKQRSKRPVNRMYCTSPNYCCVCVLCTWISRSNIPDFARIINEPCRHIYIVSVKILIGPRKCLRFFN